MNTPPTPGGQPGFPSRSIPWREAPTTIKYTRMEDAQGTVRWALVVDTPDCRSVTFWSADELERILRRGLDALGVLPDGLVLAQAGDVLPPQVNRRSV